MSFPVVHGGDYQALVAVASRRTEHEVTAHDYHHVVDEEVLRQPSAPFNVKRRSPA